MRSYLRVIRVFRREWPLIGLLLTLVGASIGVGLLQAWPTAVLVDAVLSPTPNPSLVARLFLAPLPKNVLAEVVGLTLIGMGLKVSQDGLTWVRSIVNRKIEFGGLIRVRSLMFKHFQTLGPDYHKSRPQGDALYRVTFDANGFKDVLNTLITTTVSAVRLVVMVAIMSTRSLPLTFVALAIFPAFVAINRFSGPRFRRRSAESKQQESDYTTQLQRSLSIIGLVQAFGREGSQFGRFRAANRTCARGWMNVTRENELYWFLVRTVFSVGTAMIFGFGGYLVYRDQFVLHKADGVHLGDLLLFMAYLNDLWNPLQDLTNFTANVQPPMAAVERVWSVLAEKPAVRQLSGNVRLPRARRELSFDAVHFAYDGDRRILDDVSFDVAPGQFVAFVGSSGAGKSTLLNLINRTYDPTAGRVLLDGQDVRNFRLSDIRRHVAVVPQETQLLAGTVRENLSFGCTAPADDQLRKALRLAGAEEFEDDLGAMLTEGGATLSGGQRQRLAIARAVASRAPILVLDEPTSALDPRHAHRVIDLLNDLRRHRTVAMVTHHVSSVAGCDQIFVLHQGRIAERGSHRQLMSVDGLYRSMVREELTPQAPRPALHEAA